MPESAARLETIRCRRRECQAIIAQIAPAAIVRTFTLQCPECRARREVQPPMLDRGEKPIYTELVPV